MRNLNSKPRINMGTKNWERAQVRVAKLLGGELVPYSGKGKYKGDVCTDTYLVEVKETSKAYYNLTLEDLLKIKAEALKSSKVPVFAVEFGNGDILFLIECSTIAPSSRKSYKLSVKDIGAELDFGTTSWKVISSSELCEL